MGNRKRSIQDDLRAKREVDATGAVRNVQPRPSGGMRKQRKNSINKRSGDELLVTQRSEKTDRLLAENESSDVLHKQEG